MKHFLATFIGLFFVISTQAETKLNGLHIHEVEADSEARAVVIVTHGVLEHSGRYGHLTDFLSSQGIKTVLYDLRGHHRSDGWDAYIKNFDDYVTDLETVVEFTRESNPGLPIILYGHSMGGLITYRFSVNSELTSEIAGVVLSSPGLNLPELPENKKWMKNVGPWLVKNIYFADLISLTPPIPLTSEDMTNDPEEIALHKEELKSGRSQKKMTLGLMDRLDKASQESNDLVEKWHLPLLVQQGEADTAVNAAENVKTAQAIMGRFENATLRTYNNLKHELSHAKPENRKVVFEHLGEFIDGLLQNQSLDLK